MNQIRGDSVSFSDPGFTPKQGQYLAFIYAYTQIAARPPAEADLQHHFGVTPPSVRQMVLSFEHAGLIKREPGKPRSIQLLVDPRALPLLQSRTVKSSVQRY
jgi:DNA-binding MarR family transcriptional regulator